MNIKKKILTIASLLLVTVLAAFTFAACGDKTTGPSVPGTAIEGWSDDWGKDEWGDTYEPPSSDPNDYNKIDWSEKYIDYENGITAMKGTEYLPFYAGNGAHKYEAEYATLSGKANTSEGGYYVGSLDGSSVTFDISSENECSVLVVICTAVNPALTEGLPFNQQYTLYANGTIIDTSDSWLKGTGSWFVFGENAVGEITLKAGENEIEFFSSIGRSNLDYIKLVPTKEDAEKYPPAPEKYMAKFGLNDRIEAENTNFTNAKTESSTANTGVNMSWTSYDTTVEFIVENTLDVDVTRTLRIYAAAGTGDDTSGPLSTNMAERITLSVDGEPVTLEGTLPTTEGGNWWGTYMNIDIAEVTLKAGSTSSFCLTLSDQLNIDYFEIVGDPIPVSLSVSGYKTVYYVDESVKGGDLTVTVTYDNGDTAVLGADDFTITHDAFDKPSEAQEVTVSYTKNNVTRTTSYTVAVTDTPIEEPTRLSADTPVAVTEYTEGESFSLTSLNVTGDYGNDEWRVLDREDYTLEYSLNGTDGWTDTLVMPDVDVKQELFKQQTVYIRAAYVNNPNMYASTSVVVTVYDEWYRGIVQTYADYGTADIFGMVGTNFAPFYAGNGVHMYEAENAVLGGLASKTSDHVGDLREGATVTFNVTSEEEIGTEVLLVMGLSVKPDYAATPYISFGELYGCDGNGGTAYNKVTVNGEDAIMDGMVRNTGNWNGYADSAVGKITLRPGANTLVFTFYADATNLDYIKLVPSKAAAQAPADISKIAPVFGIDDKIEAESCYYENAGIENETHLAWTNSDTVIIFAVRNDSDTAVTRRLSLYAAAGAGDSTTGPLSTNMADRISLTVGGKQVALEGTVPTPTEGNWWNTYIDIDIAEVTLEANSVTIFSIGLSDQFNPDSFSLKDVTV